MRVSPRSQLLAAALIALALLLRLTLPSGWMPSGQGVSIMPCPGAAPVMMPMHGDHAMHMAGKAGDPHQHDDGQSHDCPFAPNAAALDLVRAPAPALVAELTKAAPRGLPATVAVGRGLAAPPPPPTGPPARA